MQNIKYNTKRQKKTYNIIADVAGRFDELMMLIEKMPQGEYIFVGDLNDRGDQSYDVIEWVKQNGVCLQSNHGDMFIDFYDGITRYHSMDFINNGGLHTLFSYGFPKIETEIKLDNLIMHTREIVTPEHIEWLKACPYYMQVEGALISHAPKYPRKTLKEVSNNDMKNYNTNILWCRYEPEEIEGIVQIFGHNAMWGLREFKTGERLWGLCIDQSQQQKLTGVTWPKLEVYEQDYLDKKDKS